MEELKDKFKSLLKGSKKSTFHGTGHRLGSDAAAQPGSRKAGDTATSSSKQHEHNGKPHQPVPNKPPSSAASTNMPNLQQPSTSAGAARVEPRQELKPATEFSPFTAVIGGGAARTTNSMNPAGLAASSQQDSSGSSSTPGTGRRLGSPAAQQPQPAPVARAAVSAAVLEEQQHCLALIASQPAAAVSSMQVLHKLLSNLYTSPQEAKFRQLRLGPKPPAKIQAAVLDVSGALDFLKACGFEVHADAADSPEPGTWAYFLDDARLSHVESGLSQLQLAMQAAQQQHTDTQPQPPQGVAAAEPGSYRPVAGPVTAKSPPAAPAAAAAAGAQAPQVARNTLVLLPAAPDADVPEWFFERTAAEVKAEFMSLLRQRQAKQVVASKAWKDLKLGASSNSSRQPTAITLRVRFPEGVCLQGCFGVREPVTAVFDWVTSSLRHPGLTFELIPPSRTPLSPSGPVGAADLAGAVLNFRGLGHTVCGYLVDQSRAQLPFLSDTLLAQAQAD